MPQTYASSRTGPRPQFLTSIGIRFGRPGKGNDKGKVEGLVGYARRNFLVPVPSFPSFDALNVYLEERCLERWGDSCVGTGRR